MATLRELLERGARELQELSGTPRLEAEVLLCAAGGCTRLDCIAHGELPVSDAVQEQYLAFLQRRRRREPVAYITGRKEFFGLEFVVSPAVLVPRPETELLVERAAALLAAAAQPLLLIDLGTGSGCIAVALGHELQRLGKSFHIIAVDRSRPALAAAGLNAARHGLAQRISCVQSEWFSAIAPSVTFHAVLSNPPYVPDGAALPPELAYEPEGALRGGTDGLRDVRALLKQIPGRLGPGGFFLCEIGAGQAPLLKAELEPVSFRVHRDLQGIERIIEIDAHFPLK